MPCSTQRPLSSSFWGLPYRILNINHKKELLWGLWVDTIISPKPDPKCKGPYTSQASRTSNSQEPREPKCPNADFSCEAGCSLGPRPQYDPEKLYILDTSHEIGNVHWNIPIFHSQTQGQCTEIPAILCPAGKSSTRNICAVGFLHITLVTHRGCCFAIWPEPNVARVSGEVQVEGFPAVGLSERGPLIPKIFASWYFDTQTTGRI